MGLFSKVREGIRKVGKAVSSVVKSPVVSAVADFIPGGSAVRKVLSKVSSVVSNAGSKVGAVVKAMNPGITGDMGRSPIQAVKGMVPGVEAPTVRTVRPVQDVPEVVKMRGAGASRAYSLVTERMARGE